jgi:uncharacterized protein YdhG (YjbR/CyaY superfamily)
MHTTDYSGPVARYILAFGEPVAGRLWQVYKTIRDTVPGAEEGIRYGMPAFSLNQKPLVYFAGYKGHIGFYATPSGHEAFKEDLSKYKQGKGSVQFPHDRPLPLGLIQRITQFRAEEVNLLTKKSKPGKKPGIKP